MSSAVSIPVVSFVGKSGVGKTTVLVKVIRELSDRGYQVGTVKHDAHGFEIDRPGKDTWRHARAGSRSVVISGPHRMALIRELDQELPLERLVCLMGDLDIVLTEGYKLGSMPKIEVARRERGTTLLCHPKELIAIMTDFPVDMPVPQFGLGDVAGIADLVEQRYIENSGEAQE